MDEPLRHILKLRIRKDIVIIFALLTEAGVSFLLGPLCTGIK